MGVDPAQIRERHAAARVLVGRLAASGGQAWRMCIPPQPDDSDMALVTALDDIPRLLDALETLRKAAAQYVSGPDSASYEALCNALDTTLQAEAGR